MSGNRSSSSSSSNNSSNNSSSNSSNRNSHVSCPICSERYGTTDKIYGGTCGHVFHWHCMQRWLEESNSCPICRSSGEEYFQLYLNFEELDQNQSPSQSRNQDSAHTSSRADTMKEYENLLYESALYREEIEYLNTRISHLTLKIKLFSDSSSDSD